MKYRRLPGKKRGFYRTCSLWLGDDHLLGVESSGFSEDYHRFYFKDIQAIIARKTARSKIWSGVLAALLVLAAIAAFMAIRKHQSMGATVYAVLGGGFLVGLAINLFRGTSCVCHVQMPLAIHEWPSLRRFKQVRRLLEELRPRIQTFQGSLPIPEMRKRVDQMLVISSAAAAAGWQSPASRPLRALGRAYGGALHWSLFGLLAVDIGLTVVQYYHNNLAWSLMSLCFGLTLFILAIMALSRHTDSQVPVLARISTWVTLVNLFAISFFSYCYLFYYYFKGHRWDVLGNQWSEFSVMAEIKPFEHPPMATAYLCYLMVAGICCISGFLAMASWRRSSTK
jgi:hypothetical protein